MHKLAYPLISILLKHILLVIQHLSLWSKSPMWRSYFALRSFYPVFSCLMSSNKTNWYLERCMIPSILTRTPVPAEEKQSYRTKLHHGYGFLCVKTCLALCQRYLKELCQKRFTLVSRSHWTRTRPFTWSGVSVCVLWNNLDNIFFGPATPPHSPGM